MKPEVTFRKYLAYVASKKNNKGQEGFTLIELLVVVIIIGVLAAVALPNLLNQVGKAREVELKNAAGTVARNQQAYHFERQEFADTVAKLGLENAFANSDYLDATPVTIAGGGTNSTFASVITNNAESTEDGTRGYSSANGYTAATATYNQILCQTDSVADAGIAPTGTNADDLACDTNSAVIN